MLNQTEAFGFQENNKDDNNIKALKVDVEKDKIHREHICSIIR